MPDWKYLTTELYQSRQILALYFLRDCPYIFDIGGGQIPLARYAPATQAVYSIGPETPAHVPGDVRSFEDCDIVIPSVYGVVLLGYDMQLPEEQLDRLAALLRGARRAVLEAAVSYLPGIEGVTKLIERSGRQVKWQFTLDFSENDVGEREDSWPPRPERQLWVLG